VIHYASTQIEHFAPEMAAELAAHIAALLVACWLSKLLQDSAHRWRNVEQAHTMTSEGPKFFEIEEYQKVAC